MDHAAEYELIPLLCENWTGLRADDCGLWSETPPPGLRGVQHEPQRYLQAIRRINRVHQEDVLYRLDQEVEERVRSFVLQRRHVPLRLLLLLLDFWFIIFILLVCYFVQKLIQEEAERILGLLKKAVGEASALLCDEDVLMGCESNVKLLVMQTPLSACRGRLADRFKPAVVKYSSAYVCHVQRHVAPASTSEEPGHLLCFCQYDVLSQRI